MKKYLILILLILGLGLFSSNPVNANDYRDIDLYFSLDEINNKVKLSVYNPYTDLTSMKLFKDDVLFLDLDINEPFKTYYLTGFIKDISYNFQVLYSIEGDPNEYSTIINTFVSPIDIIHDEDLEDNPPINNDLPNGVGIFTQIHPNTYEFNYTYPDNVKGTNFTIEFDDMPMWLQYSIDYIKEFGIVENVIQKPVVLTNKISVLNKDVKFYSNILTGMSADYYVYLNFDHNIDLIKSITFEFSEQKQILGIPISKKDIKQTIITPKDSFTIPGLFTKYTWESISKSDDPDFDWSVRLGFYQINSIKEVITLSISYQYMGVNYENIPVEDTHTNPTPGTNPPRPMTEINPLDFAGFFKALFSINSISDFFVVIIKFIREFLISILFIVFSPFIFKFITSLFEFLFSLLNSTLAMFNKNKYESR